MPTNALSSHPYHKRTLHSAKFSTSDQSDCSPAGISSTNQFSIVPRSCIPSRSDFRGYAAERGVAYARRFVVGLSWQKSGRVRIGTPGRQLPCCCSSRLITAPPSRTTCLRFHLGVFHRNTRTMTFNAVATYVDKDFRYAKNRTRDTKRLRVDNTP